MEADKINTTELAHKNQDIIGFFEKDASFVFAYKKTEKLASAVYMITNLFSDNEPMKWTLRTKSAELLSLMLKYKDIKDFALQDFTYSSRSKILEMISLLEISYRAGLVSHMNFSIIKHELSNLSEVFSSTNHSTKESAHQNIPKSFFSVPDTRMSQIERPTSGQNVSHDMRQDYGQNVTLKDTVVVKDGGEFKRSNRQNIILGLLKKKKDLTIKDIALVIKDCSEKTIQRELISFIEAGVLKRTGERRWSKYSLA